jgi:hypothetical protein
MVPSLSSIPNDIKSELEKLTMIEEMLISPILAVMSIYRLPGGALISRGFCANFMQDIQPICQILPRLSKDLPILILKKKDQMNNVKQFQVNRSRVQKVLEYLCKNNTAYIKHQIIIDNDNLDLLPENGIPSDLSAVEDDENTNIDSLIVDIGPKLIENHDQNQEDDQDGIQTYVETDENHALQIDNIKNAISFPTASTKAINEFEIDSICSLLFPKLFPDGSGDPTCKSN